MTWGGFYSSDTNKYYRQKNRRSKERLFCVVVDLNVFKSMINP